LSFLIALKMQAAEVINLISAANFLLNSLSAEVKTIQY